MLTVPDMAREPPTPSSNHVPGLPIHHHNLPARPARQGHRVPLSSHDSWILSCWFSKIDVEYATVICILFCTTQFSWGLFGCVATDILGLISARFQTPDLLLTKYVKLQHNQIVLTKIGCAKQYANHCKRVTIWACFQVWEASLNRECLHNSFYKSETSQPTSDFTYT